MQGWVYHEGNEVEISGSLTQKGPFKVLEGTQAMESWIHVSILNKAEMAELPQQVVEKVIKRPREMRTLEWLYSVRSEDLPEDYVLWKGSEDTSVSKAIWHRVVG